tara:strand:+ start:371 stop:568 length:198 start_codon:yes stop_codon:yes gene_type:complete
MGNGLCPAQLMDGPTYRAIGRMQPLLQFNDAGIRVLCTAQKRQQELKGVEQLEPKLSTNQVTQIE